MPACARSPPTPATRRSSARSGRCTSRPTSRRCARSTPASRWSCRTSRRPASSPTSRSAPALVAAAHEGVRTAITAAERLAAGARFTYAVCRPPGHHAGPDFLGGYCYLNNAAAAVRTLRDGRPGPGRRPRPRPPLPERDLGPGRARCDGGDPALAARGAGHQRRRRHRAARAPRANAPSPSPTAPTRAPTWRRSRPRSTSSPPSAAVLVVSLGYDTVAGDPHGCWDFAPPIFAESAACSPPLGPAGLRDPGGRLLARRAWPSAATPSPPACSGARSPA